MTEEEIKKERTEKYQYGHDFGHVAIGKIWAGVLSAHFGKAVAPIPAHVVSAMMAGLKLYRATIPGDLQEDSFQDAKIYTDFALESKRNLLFPEIPEEEIPF